MGARQPAEPLFLYQVNRRIAVKKHFLFLYESGWLLVLVLVAIAVGGCAQDTDLKALNPVEGVEVTPSEEMPQSPADDDPYGDIPAEARQPTRSGDPRPPAYWAVWNSCATENRAAEAAANGGSQAGWFLVDDVIADPGIQLGDFPITSCAESLSLLERTGKEDDFTDDPVNLLAGELLAAELNLNVGAESCPIAEEVVVGGHIILSEAAFGGRDNYVKDKFAELAEASSRIIQLLIAYNRGELCR